MLSEEIFAVEFIAFAFDRALRAGRAAIIRQTKVLGGYMALPLVLGTERAGAAGKGEGAGEGSGVCCCNVLAE